MNELLKQCDWWNDDNEGNNYYYTEDERKINVYTELHHFPWLFHDFTFPWLFHDHFGILWLFQVFHVFQVSGHPVIYLAYKKLSGGVLGQTADLHMAQMMPLPLTISCSSKSRLALPSWFYLLVPAHSGCHKGPLNGCSSSSSSLQI